MGTLYLIQPRTGRSLYLYLVLNWNQVKRTPIPRKDVFNRGFATTEGEVYSDEPRTHIIICRLTSAEKASLYDIDDEQEHVQINEGLTIHSRCWIDSITVDYKIVEHADAPWVVTINLVEVGVPLIDVAELYNPVADDGNLDIRGTLFNPVADDGNLDIRGTLFNPVGDAGNIDIHGTLFNLVGDEGNMAINGVTFPICTVYPYGT